MTFLTEDDAETESRIIFSLIFSSFHLIEWKTNHDLYNLCNLFAHAFELMSKLVSCC